VNPPIRTTDRGMWRIVARRDLWVRVRDRGFVISTAITLTVLTIMIVLRSISGSGGASYTLGVVGDPAVAQQAVAVGEQAGVKVEVRTFADPSTAEQALRGGQVSAVLEEEQLIGLHGVPGQLEQVVQGSAIAHRIQDALDRYGAPPDVQASLNDQAPLSVVALEPADPHRETNGGIALIGVILLYGQLFGYGVWVATGVIEEKSSRVVEILLSAIRPRQLMAGKIVGIGLLGLGQLTVIAVYAITLGTATGALPIPGSAAWTALLDIGWFILGFSFYATLFAVAGSLVSRMEELQNAMTPINLTVLVSFFISVGALQAPDSTLAVIASILPTSSALAMPVRITLGAAEPWQIALSLILVVGSTALLVPLAARLYSGAVLRTGARVRLRDAWRSTTRVRHDELAQPR
jgi:ABC-2 type transport system permease protein